MQKGDLRIIEEEVRKLNRDFADPEDEHTGLNCTCPAAVPAQFGHSCTAPWRGLRTANDTHDLTNSSGTDEAKADQNSRPFTTARFLLDARNGPDVLGELPLVREQNKQCCRNYRYNLERQANDNPNLPLHHLQYLRCTQSFVLTYPQAGLSYGYGVVPHRRMLNPSLVQNTDESIAARRWVVWVANCDNQTNGYLTLKVEGWMFHGLPASIVQSTYQVIRVLLRFRVSHNAPNMNLAAWSRKKRTHEASPFRADKPPRCTKGFESPVYGVCSSSGKCCKQTQPQSHRVCRDTQQYSGKCQQAFRGLQTGFRVPKPKPQILPHNQSSLLQHMVGGGAPILKSGNSLPHSWMADPNGLCVPKFGMLVDMAAKPPGSMLRTSLSTLLGGS